VGNKICNRGVDESRENKFLVRATPGQYRTRRVRGKIKRLTDSSELDILQPETFNHALLALSRRPHPTIGPSIAEIDPTSLPLKSYAPDHITVPPS
jgi:hypothetical protein